jgi:isopenicillin-N N-acyltransferase-like protein
MKDIASPFPLIRISSADARERGRIMGEEARDRIVESVDAYQETFDHYTGLPWDEVTELALEFAPPIEAYDPEILAEIEGTAEGAGLTLGDLLAVNARSEIMFGLNAVPPPECTAFFVAPAATADGHTLIGQNWDWRPRAIESTTLFEIEQGPDKPSLVMLPEAGLVGKTGFNEHGIGITLNALVSDLDKGERQVPIHVIMRGVLNSRTIEEAFGKIAAVRRAASGNYTIGSATGVGMAVEVGPGGPENVGVMKPVDDVVSHSNHFACPISFTDVGRGKWTDTEHRIDTMRDFLVAHHGEITTETMKEVLRDDNGHPDAICRFPNPEEHPVEQAATVASVIIDLTERTAEITAGPPNESEYFHFTPEFAAASPAAL